jgi:hypothetical protein
MGVNTMEEEGTVEWGRYMRDKEERSRRISEE